MLSCLDVISPLRSMPLASAVCVASVRPLQIALLGEPVDLTYRYDHLGSDPSALASLSNSPFMEKLKAAKNPAIVVGPGASALCQDPGLLHPVSVFHLYKACISHSCCFSYGKQQVLLPLCAQQQVERISSLPQAPGLPVYALQVSSSALIVRQCSRQCTSWWRRRVGGMA